MRVKTADTEKKWLQCLGCGDMMWTDRCHRICRKCRRRNNASPARSPYLIPVPRDFELHHVASYDGDDW